MPVTRPLALLCALAALASSPASAATTASLGLASLLAGTGPTLSGGGELVPCKGAPAPSDGIATAVTAAERALGFVQPGEALALLGHAEATLPCLVDPPSANLLARAAFLRGIADPDHALAAFAEAIARRPALTWDDTFPPGLRPVFERAAAEAAVLPAARLEVVPAPAPGTLWVDGRQVQTESGFVDLRPGTRLVQLAGVTWESALVRLGPGERALLLHADSIAGHEEEVLSDPERRAALALAMQRAVPVGTALTVTGPGGPWELEVGQEWKRGTARRPAARVLEIGGAGLLTAAVAVGGASVVEYESARAAMLDAATFEEAKQHEAAGNLAGRGVQAAEWAGAAGGLLLGAGLAFEIHWGGPR